MALIAEQAPRLIASGVTSLTIDNFSVTLAPPAPPVHPQPKPEPVAQSHINPLRDASTYPGGRVPGFTREDEIP